MLQNNGGDNLSVTAAGPFTFATKVNSGAAYNVTVMTQPTGQTCTPSNNTGTATANVTTVTISCTNSGSGVTIGGTVTGLTGTGLALLDNGGDSLAVTANGPFTFKTSLATGTAYAVTVGTQPTGPAQTCTVTNGTGTTGTTNVTTVAVSCTGGTASVGKFAYVANNGDDTIDAYSIDPTSGALAVVGTPITDGTTASGPAAVSLAPNGKWAYSATDNGLHIYAYSIDQTTGGLTPIGSPVSTGFTTGMAFPDIAVDANSAHLYVASAGDGKVAGFAIQADGSLQPLTGSPYPAGAGASAIPAFSPDGKFLYVMDRTANAVSGYAIGSDGSLTPIAGSPFSVGTAPIAGPTWISFTPNGKWAYVADTDGSDALSIFSVDATTGALTLLPGPAKPPEEHPEDLTIDTSGTHLYVPVGNGTAAGAVDVYTINDTDGSLTFVGATGVPAGVTPLFLNIAPNGKFAYVASKGGAEVFEYSIDSSTGALTPLSPASVSTGAGSFPQFITIDPSGKFGYTANEGTANISEFAIDQTSGVLTPITGHTVIAAGLKPIFVSISPEAPGIRD